MIHIAAVGDIHIGLDARGAAARHFEHVAEHADVLLLAGDLTRVGAVEEAQILARDLRQVVVPVIAVLGNHDHHAGHAAEVTAILAEAGVTVLDGSSAIIDVGGHRLGVVGAKGFGGGFAGASASEFGEPEMKAFVSHTRSVADQLRSELDSLVADCRVVLLHYSPIEATLHGERLEIYPFLGSYLLAEAIDAAGADLVLHGHAHGGSEKGMTPGGVPVRNVAQPVLRASYGVYCLMGEADDVACADGQVAGLSNTTDRLVQRTSVRSPFFSTST